MHLTLSLLGSFSARIDGTATTFATTRARALLAYLAVNAGQPHQREVLAELLFPDQSVSDGRASLRKTLYRVRRAIGDAEPSPLDATRSTLTFNRAAADVDLDNFNALLEACGAHDHDTVEGCSACIDRLTAAVALYRGPFLEDVSLAGNQRFEEWLLFKREQVQQRALDALQTVIAHHEQAGAHENVITYARRRLDVEPWSESSYYSLIRALLLTGRRGEAVRQYEKCRRILREEFNVKPSDKMRALAEQLTKGAPPSTTEPVRENPYKGLHAFGREDAEHYFGREHVVESLVDAVTTRHLVAVVGPSGSGKTSLVDAGLLPRLDNGAGGTDRPWHIVTMRPGSRPFAQLIASLEPMLEGADDTDEVAQQLRHGDIGWGDLVERVQPGRLLVVIDQFEELYTLCDDATCRRAFLDVLLSASCCQRSEEAGQASPSPRSAPHTTVVLTMRADFMGAALSYRPFADVLDGDSHILGPMNREELRRAIEEPARRQGIAFEPGLVQRLLDDAGDAPGTLPLLEFALTRLWEQRTEGWLSHAAYDEIGGLEGALTRYADDVHTDLSQEDKERARRLFVQMVQPGEGTDDTRRQLTRDDVSGDDWRLVQQLADTRLVVTSTDAAGDEIAELAHEVLIHEWDRLRNWMEEDRAIRLWQQRLRSGRRQWEASGRDDAALLRGALLAEAEELAADRPEYLSESDEAFIAASVAWRDAQRRAEEERHERELEQANALAEVEREKAATEAQSSRRLRWLAAGLTLGVLLTILAATYAFIERGEARTQADRAQQAQAAAETQRRQAEAEAQARANEVVVRSTAEARAEAARAEAQQQARLAQSAQLVAESRLAAGTKPVRSRLLAIEANRVRDEDDPYRPAPVQALRDALRNPLGRPLVGHDDLVVSAAMHPDGTWLASSEPSGRILLWSLEDPSQPPHELQGHIDLIRVMTFSPDGTSLASASVDGTARLWPISDAGAGEPRVLDDHDAEVEDVAFSPDGEWLATASRDGTARVWSVENPDAEPRVLAGEEGWVWKVTFSPDGEWLATGSFDGFIRFWSLTDEEAEPLVFRAHGIWARQLRFSPDGEWLISGGADAVVNVWSVAALATGTVPEPITLPGEDNNISDIAFSPDGESFATAGVDTTARLYSLDDPTADPVVFRGHSNIVKDVEFSPDGETLATSSDDGTARLWSASDPKAPSRLLNGHDEQLNVLLFTPDGRRLVTASNDTLVRLWPTDDASRLQREPRILRGHTDGMYEMLVTSDGEYLFSASADGTVRVWSMRDGATPRASRVLPHESKVLRLALSPDERLLATGTISGTVRIWPLDEVIAADDPGTSEVQPTVLDGHTSEIWSLSFSSDGQWLVSGSLDGTARMWPVGDNLATEPRIFEHDGAVVDAEISPDGRWLVAAGGEPNYTARVWALAGDGETYVLDGYEDQVWDTAFSPDGRWLVAGSWDGTVRAYQVPNFDASATILYRDPKPIELVRFSPDGTWLAAGKGVIRLWPAANLDAEPIVLSGHERAVPDFAFSPDEEWLVTANRDRAVRLWNLNAPDAGAQVLRGHDDEVISVAFDPDGRWIASGTHKPPIRLWRTDFDTLVDMACERTGRNLTREEWALYFREDQPYRPTCPQWPTVQ